LTSKTLQLFVVGSVIKYLILGMNSRIFAVNVKSVLNMSQVFAENVIANDIKDATIVSISSAVRLHLLY